jgi:YhcH/YjgK/YiaL family protein
MLVGQLHNPIETGYYPDVIIDILTYLKSLKLDELSLGRHSIPFLDHAQAWFVLLEYQTEAKEAFQPEVHRHFSDLQIVLAGQEKMAWCFDQGTHTEFEAYNPVRDILFYQHQGIELNEMVATPGQFYLFTPSIIHITNISNHEVSNVRKLVVKIHNNLLFNSHD